MGEADEKGDKQERRFDPELLKKGLRCDLDQYDMLKHCSDKKDMTEWNEWRENNPDRDVCLDGAKFTDCHLRNANFMNGRVCSKKGREIDYSGKVYLRNTNFEHADVSFTWFANAYLEKTRWWHANVVGANLHSARLYRAELEVSKLDQSDFTDAVMRDARLTSSSLRGAKFMRADLRGCNARVAIVDGSTQIWLCKVDNRTDFTGTGLDIARIDAATKQLLEYNIRRMSWEQWYRKGRWWAWFLKSVFIKPFWWMSDYGMSTVRVVGTFFLLAFLFAGIYANWAYWRPPGIVHDLVVQPEIGEAGWHYCLRAPVRAVYFSIVTMTTLGFGDMYANKGSIAGHVILAVQVILGYVLLGALVTRFAVLFTAGGPAGKFAVEKKETRE